MKPYFLLLFSLLFSCQADRRQAIIIEYIETSGGVRTYRDTRILSLRDAGWITGRDSLLMVQESVKAEKLDVIKHVEYLVKWEGQYGEIVLLSDRDTPGLDTTKAKLAAIKKEYAETRTKMDNGYRGISPKLDSLLDLEAYYAANQERKLLPIVEAKYTWQDGGQKKEATTRFVMDGERVVGMM